MTNVVGMNGESHDRREANKQCVEVLEDLLERAKSGEVVGFAAALMYHDEAAGTVAGGYVEGYRMVGAAEVVKMVLVETALGEGD